MLFSLLKHYFNTDTALKVSQSVYCFTTSISHGVENYFPRLWGMGIADAIFILADSEVLYWFFEIQFNSVFTVLVDQSLHLIKRTTRQLQQD